MHRLRSGLQTSSNSQTPPALHLEVKSGAGSAPRTAEDQCPLQYLLDLAVLLVLEEVVEDRWQDLVVEIRVATFAR
jgi:hypothetical protein